jgi:hypothetical protein
LVTRDECRAKFDKNVFAPFFSALNQTHVVQTFDNFCVELVVCVHNYMRPVVHYSWPDISN